VSFNKFELLLLEVVQQYAKDAMGYITCVLLEI